MLIGKNAVGILENFTLAHAEFIERCMSVSNVVFPWGTQFSRVPPSLRLTALKLSVIRLEERLFEE
jgi:hypothetical protein